MANSAVYSHEDLVEYAELALHEHHGKIGLAVAELRRAFPILTLRSALDLCNEARTYPTGKLDA